MDHIWAKMTITPVHVLPDEDGEPRAFTDPDAMALAEQNAQFGCMACDKPLAEAYGTICEGESSS